MRKTVFSITMLLFTMYCHAQVWPENDINWKINSNKSDEFNAATLDLNLWRKLPKDQYPWGNGHCFDPVNVYLENGLLKLKVVEKTAYDSECDQPWSNYYTGGIQSQEYNYAYGYFEIKAKLPGMYINGRPNGKGFWPAFWTFYAVHVPGCKQIHDETDILEPNGEQYATAKTNVAGVHDEDGNCITYKFMETSYTHTDPLFADFHTYGAEWLPDRIIFYFDGVPYGAILNHPGIVMQPHSVVIDQQMDANHSVDPDMLFPQFMEVDYFRYHELSMDCNVEEVVIFDNYNFLDPANMAVKKSWTISSSTIPVNSNTTIRATDFIELKKGFNVPENTIFNAVTNPCY